MTILDLHGRAALPVQHLKMARNHADCLERDGFAFVPGEHIAMLTAGADLAPLLDASRNLPVDPTSDGLKFRVYRTATYFPWDGSLRFDPAFEHRGQLYVPYFQPLTINQAEGGRERRFPPVPPHLEQDPLLQRLVRRLFSLIPASMIEHRLPVRVGIHIIRLFSDGWRVSLAAPNYVHCDGEPWTAIINLERSNVTDWSATNMVARRHCAGIRMQDVLSEDILYRGVMQTPLDTAIVDDARVAHAVSGVLGSDNSPGWRTSLLIDFSDIRLYRTPDPV